MKSRICSICNSIIICALLVCPQVSLSGLADFTSEKEQELLRYIEIFSGPFRMEQHVAAEALAYAGISDQKLFDVIENQLLNNYKSISDSYDIDWASWLAKALAFSGDKKYLGTLEVIFRDAPQKKLRKYAKVAIKLQPKYEKWNKIIADNTEFLSEYSIAINRYSNMLNSDVPDLHKLAAKRIFFEGIDIPFMRDLVIYRIGSPAPNTDKDTKKWLKKSLCTSCKTFGSKSHWLK